MKKKDKDALLTEQDYLSILDSICQFNSCESLDSLMKVLENKVFPLVNAQAGVFAHLEPEIKNCEVIEAINISPATVDVFQKWVPNSQLSIMASTSNRPVVAYGVDRDRKELDEEVIAFLEEEPQYTNSDFSYFNEVSGVMVAIDRPEPNIGMGFHRLKPCKKPFTLREVRIVELLRPHLCHTIRTLVLSRQLAQYKSLAEEILGDLPSPIALVNKNFWIIYCNKKFENLFPLQPGNSLPQDLIDLVKKELSRRNPPFHVNISQLELSFYTLPQGKFRLNVSLLKGRGSEEDHPLLVRLKPAVEPYSKMNWLLQEKGLTGRETEICVLTVDGMENKEIADRLFISPATVKTHLRHIFKKLNAHTRLELINKINKAK